MFDVSESADRLEQLVQVPRTYLSRSTTGRSAVCEPEFPAEQCHGGDCSRYLRDFGRTSSQKIRLGVPSPSTRT